MPTNRSRLHLVACGEKKEERTLEPTKSTAAVIEMPVDLPMSFFRELGQTKCIQQYTALYWEPTVDRLIINNGQSLRFTTNEWVFVALLNYEPIAEWLTKSGINFGLSVEAAKQWMVVDHFGMRAYAVAVDVARHWVQQQRKPG